MLLDTNIVSKFLAPDAMQRTPKLVELVNAHVATGDLAVAYVTRFELLRGLEELLRRGQGRRRLVAFEKFMDGVQVLGLDGDGWNLAAGLWAEGRAKGRVFSDADLLIATTAAFHRLDFATNEKGLVEGLRVLTLPIAVHLVAAE